ncbi:MAG TPA: histidine ammonia-lyase [Candidatus Marinimicrobia bacterium]|nr:histidine ammonia-lyase [Candidatus Neomarinimicrobiota bacterium]
MNNKKILIDGSNLSLDDFRFFLENHPKAAISPKIMENISRTRQYIEKRIQSGDVVYGLNTGFGHLASEHIPYEQLQKLQLNLIRSHAAGIGEPMSIPIVRLMMLIKIVSLARGFSGVRPAVLEQLLFFLNEGITPVIPKKGSVGASGDLAPLAHLALPLIGEGEVFYKDKRQPAADVLHKLSRLPLVLEAKEGLAIINGTQSMVAHGIRALLQMESLLYSSELISAASIDALKGSLSPFHPAIQQAKGSPFNAALSKRIRRYLLESEINASHKGCGKVQDPYSFRCSPQVLGAIWEAFDHAQKVLIREANAVSDNPLIFPDEELVLSGGNFHGESPALVMDYLALAVAEMGAISERRIAILVDKHMSGLPAFLIKNSGINSGFMIAHVTAAALASENKTLAHPASVDSLPTSANQEDHVSMGHWAGQKLLQVLENVEAILAVELISAMQGIDMHRPLKSSPIIEELYHHFRETVPFWEYDRLMHRDIEAAVKFIRSNLLFHLVKEIEKNK